MKPHISTTSAGVVPGVLHTMVIASMSSGIHRCRPHISTGLASLRMKRRGIAAWCVAGATASLLLTTSGTPAKASELIVTNGATFDLTANTTSDGASIGINHNLYSGNSNPSGAVTVEAGVIWNINAGPDTSFPGASLWINSTYKQHAAYTGVATLDMLNGSTVDNSGAAEIGDNNWGTSPYPTGVMDVAAGATFNNYGQFYLQRGTVTIEGATNINSSSSGGLATIGGDQPGSAVMTVSGQNAVLNVNDYGDLEVSNAPGSAQVNIEEGGTVNSGDGMIGTSSSSQKGTVVVQGDSALGLTSTWKVSDYVSVGEYGGQGTLTVNDSGSVETQRTFIGGFTGNTGTGTVTINSGGTIAVQSTFQKPTVEMWSGSTLDVSGGGKMLIGNGIVNNVPAGTIEVSNGGTLKGEGTVKGNVFVTGGGTISPGHSPGTINIAGDLTADSAGVFTIEIAGPSSYDIIDVTGALDFGGGQLNLDFINGYTPTEGQKFNLTPFIANTLTGMIGSVSVSGLSSGQTANVDLSGLSSGQLAYTTVAVPEPASLVLLAIGSLALIRTRQKAGV